jgi:hypothetical protein
MERAPPRWQPAPLGESYGFTSGLVIPASDQREDVVVPPATLMMRVGPIALHHLP